jgi:hypothetical protein
MSLCPINLHVVIFILINYVYNKTKRTLEVFLFFILLLILARERLKS